jgi:hypothetical protein
MMHSPIAHNRPMRRRIAATALLASVGLVACGGSEEQPAAAVVEQTDPAEEQVSDQSEPAAEQTDTGDTGRGADLPDEFPKDMVPVPDDADVITTSTLDNGDGVAYTLIYNTSKNVDEIADYYSDALKSKWNEVMKTSSDGSVFLAFASESDGSGDGVQITAGPASDGSDMTGVSVLVILVK